MHDLRDIIQYPIHSAPLHLRACLPVCCVEANGVPQPCCKAEGPRACPTLRSCASSKSRCCHNSCLNSSCAGGVVGPRRAYAWVAGAS